MDTRRWMRLRVSAGWQSCAILACLALSACGGANKEDAGTITGNPPGGNKPTVTLTPLPSPTATLVPTPPPPFIIPVASTLFVGFGAPPLDCNGSKRTFTVSGVNPPFTLKATGGCLDPAIVGESGGEFTFTAGEGIGDFRIGVTDSAGKQAAADVTLRGAPASFLRVDLAVQQMFDNGDGTFTSVVGALVTDENGTAVPSGIPVDFTLVDPEAGVSVTTPGFTAQAAPCTLDGSVIPQPGDALSCIKYARSLQGRTVMLRARIKTEDGSVLEDVRTVSLPTSPETATPTSTPTVGTPTTTPAAAFVRLELAANRVTNNGDGTLTTVAGALITDAHGVAIGDGIAVAFDVVEPVSGVSVTSPGFTHQAQPCTVDFTVLPQPGDALTCVKYGQSLQGMEVAIHVRVSTPQGVVEDTQTIILPDLRPTATPTLTSTTTPTATDTPTLTPTPTITPTATPPAAFITLQLVEPRASDNGDGTLSAVIGALVTDEHGVVIGDGVPVTFNLVTPVGGVSLTSPGFTNQAPPCTLGFTVVPQPGDALSCVKYARNQQGVMIEVRASVSTPSGVIEDTVTITLPDFRPTATPTPTLTPTETPTPTATPAAAFITVQLVEPRASDNGDGTLSAVVGALVTDAHGVVIGNGVPVTFNLVTPVGGVSLTSPGFTGQAPPCTLGFTVVPQPGDALSCVKYARNLQGTTIDVRASVFTAGGVIEDTVTITLPDLRETATPTATPTLTPTVTPTSTITPTATPAAVFITLQLVEPRANDNGDGTLSAVIGALVTDANGVAIGNGVPVTFNLVTPIGGVSLTSPGFTGQAPPCTLGFTVVPQPGDALSCVKYGSNLQGTMIQVRATVSTPSGVIQDVATITLPDLRPTATSTLTPTPTPTRTATPTVTPTATPPAVFIAIQLATNLSSDNGDGTFSTVVGALVSDANGVAVGNGVAVTFNLVTPIAGVSLTSPGFTGQPAPCTLSFTVVPQPGDALSCVKYTNSLQGTSIQIRAIVATPNGTIGVTSTIVLPDLRPSPTSTSTPTPTPTPTATPTPAAVFITVELGTDQASDNGDGTLTTVIGALITDANGVTIGDGAAVQFSLVSPIPGVSVTSPGFTHLQAPCTLAFTVVPQPGDALSCVKYSKTLQGTTITVRARVQGAGGTIEDTADVILPNIIPTPTPTPTQTPTPTPTGMAFSVHFVGAQPPEIGVRASGLPEQSVLTFQVTDPNTNPVAGVKVTFTLTGIDDETIDPLQTITDANGLVHTTLTSGIRASTLRIVAGADVDGNGTTDIFAQSTAVSVFGAPPVQNRFSVAAEKLNVAGRVFFGIEDAITAFVNDRFGNAVPPGTAVSFISNGASVVDPTETDAQGRAVATLITEAQVPPTGIVTVLGFTRGEEQFLDNNGNGIFDQGIDTIVGEGLREPFIDFRPLPPLDAGCPIFAPNFLCNAAFDINTPFELFVDENHDGLWSVQGTIGVWDNNLLLFDVVPVTFSGPLEEPEAFSNQAATIPLTTFAIPDAGSIAFFLTVHDDLVNPLVGGSTIEVKVQGANVFPPTVTLPDTQSFNRLIPGRTVFAFSAGDATPQENPALPPQFTSIVVTITSENGNGSFVVATGTVD